MLKFIRKIHSSRQLWNGYIVLVPEIGEDKGDNLLNNGLPKFDEVTVENCVTQIGVHSNNIRRSLNDIEKKLVNTKKIDISTIKWLLSELDEVSQPLETTWGIAKTLYLANTSTMPTKSYLNIHEKARSAKASKYINSTIYHFLKNIYGNEDIKSQLNSQEIRFIEKYILEGKLNGLDLNQLKMESFIEIINSLGKERIDFMNRVNQATNNFVNTISDYNLMRYFPDYFLEKTAKDSKQPTLGPWKITLQPNIYAEFLKYCPDRSQRWNIWQANTRKCSLHSGSSLETSTIIEKIRGFRQKQANLLGFPNYAEMAMATKMLKSVEDVKDIFANLLKCAGPAQNNEISKLQEFANISKFNHNLDLYDIEFWNRKKNISDYELDENKIREYFPFDKVVQNIFKIFEALFHIKIIQNKNVNGWQPNIEYYDIFQSGNSQEPLCGFYVDYYKRDFVGQFTGHVVGIRNSPPLSALIFNFPEQFYGKPYLLNIGNVKTILKSFGTLFQQILTKVNYNELSGLSNLEWDASQVCGEVFVNFLENTEFIQNISSHYETGESLNQELALKIIQVNKTLAGYKLCEELYYAHLDIELFSSKDFWLDIMKRLWPVYRPIPLDKKNAHVCSMSNIIAGDWSSAYYSNLYSKVLAADIYEAFQDKNPKDNKSVGLRFRDTFLSTGGSENTLEVFRQFRGRDPSTEAFLNLLNISNFSHTSVHY